MATFCSTDEAIHSRRAVRTFSQQEIPDGLLESLLELANRAPSGFNLQPWQFVVVNDSEVKELLCHVAMNQQQVREAPATVVFLANPRAWRENYDTVLALGEQSGIMSREHREFYRKSVSMLFRTSPFGLFGLIKRVGLPLVRLLRPMPKPVTSTTEATAYVRSQTMLAAATFMIAARGAGLHTSPMEGFDEERVKKLLAIPNYMTIPLMIAVGYEVAGTELPQTVRLPLQQKLSYNQYLLRTKGSE